MIGRLVERAQDIRSLNGVAPTAVLLERAASCIEAMARFAARDLYAALSGASSFREMYPSNDDWAEKNWRGFVPEVYRDLIGGGE